MNFFTKLEAAARRNDTLLCVGLDPTPAACPARFRTGDSQPDAAALLRWNRAVIDATAGLVCCYKPNIAFYEALGQPGMQLLRETIGAIPDDIPVLLDAKRGDMGPTAEAYARACFDELGADAVTLSPYLGQDSIAPFAAYPGKGLFVLSHTSNPSAGQFQHLAVGAGQQPLFMEVARQAVGWSPQVGLVVGATYPQALADVRAVAPDAWFLVPGVGAQGGDPQAALAAGLRADGLGLLFSSSRGIAQADDPAQAAADLRDQINRARASQQPRPSPPAKARHPLHDLPLHDLIVGLAELEALKFGNFTLASGKQSHLYVDLRLLVSAPGLLQQAARAYAQVLAGLARDRIAGVPYAALPIGTAVSLASGVPLIYNRKERKSHGLGKNIEGQWQPGERVVIIEDVITTGGSIVSSVELFREAGLVVEDAIVLLDRQQGGVENLAGHGIRVHSVLGLAQVLDVLVAAGRLDGEMRRAVAGGR